MATDASRLAPARRRVRNARAAAAALGLAGFGLLLALSRSSHHGHAKTVATSLSAPPDFVAIVRRNQLESGLVGPAFAPTDAVTAVS